MNPAYNAGMKLLALAASLALAGCGGGASTTVKAPQQPAVDEKSAERDAKGLVTEIYATLGNGNKDSLFSLLDDSLVVFGPRPRDALGNRSDVLVALGELVQPKQKLALRSGSLAVVAASGGRSAWVSDVVNVAGAPHAVTAILVNTDDLWQVKIAAIAALPSRGRMKAELEKHAIVPPAASAKAGVEGDARGAVERFERILLDAELAAEDLGGSADARFVGPLAGEVVRGKKELKKLFKKRGDAKLRAAPSGDIAAGTTPDGQLAWVSAPVTRVGDKEDPLPLRAFAVFERAGGGWRLVALQESLAIGEPGAGAAFEKQLPPEPKADKPEPEPEKKPKKTDEKPKKKKKKKKPASD